MAELKNTFSWSFSAAGDFDECRRKRYWSKYGMWKGWDPKASELQRKAYRFNKMDNRYSLQGNAVEYAVMWVLRQKQEGKDVTADEAYEQIAKPFLNKSWKESRDGTWQADPKRHCCLHEHYYPDLNPTPEKEWTAALAEHTKLCIANFIERVLPRLEHVKPEQEVDIATPEKGGDPESFEFEGTKIYAIPDYVYRVDDQWHIHDWKSGKSRPEHKQQLVLYGLWANLKHGVPPENVFVYIEYLRDGVVALQQLTDRDLETVKAQIRDSVTDMTGYLVDGDTQRNAALPREEWDLAPTRSPCRRCNFYELCEPEFED